MIGRNKADIVMLNEGIQERSRCRNTCTRDEGQWTMTIHPSYSVKQRTICQGTRSFDKIHVLDHENSLIERFLYVWLSNFNHSEVIDACFVE